MAFIHEKIDGLIHGHVAGVHADAGDVAGVAEERVLNLAKAQFEVATAVTFREALGSPRFAAV